MEKIYIENNKQNNKNFLQSKSIVGTFALAIIAVVAIVIVGLNQTSYAIPEVTNKLPDTFTTADVDGNETINTYPTAHPVNPFRTTAEYGSLQLFCMQANKDFAGGKTYMKDAAIEDYGLLYLLAKLSSDEFDETFAVYTDENLKSAVKTWVSQVSIWMYLNDSRVTPESVIGNYKFADGDQENLMNAKALILGANENVYYKVDGSVGLPSESDSTFYDKYVKNLVEEAIANKGTPNKFLKINTATNNISLTSDDKYYQTSQISVTATPSANFNGYSVELKSAPEGSFIVDENGNKISDNQLSNMASTDKFYVRVPVNKVNENNKKIEIGVTGSFTTLEGNYYLDTAGQYQTVAAVQTVTNNVQTDLEIPLNYTPNVPDTGLSTAQTVYFIGLIVLLSGIGIIYANVKPSESK